MKKLFLCLAACLMTGAAMAAVSVPQDREGHSVSTVHWIGASQCSIDNSTGTNVVLCFSGQGIVYGVIASSISTTDFLTFRDTNTANLTSSTYTVVFPIAPQVAPTANGSSMITFPVPMKIVNGLSVNDTNAPAAGSRWTILYRTQAQSLNE